MKFRARRGLVVASLIGLLAGACGAGSGDGATAVTEALASTDGAVSASLAFNDWGAGYTGNVTVTNNGNTPTSTWSVVIDTRGSVVSQAWNATSQIAGNLATFSPVSWNAVIAPHQSVTFGFNASPGGASNEGALVSVTQSGATGGTSTGGGTAGAGGTGGGAGHAGTGGTAGTTGGAGTGGMSSSGTGTCTAQTFEAESITHSTGGAQDSGWDIWSNGSVSTSVALGGGSTTITVTAKGTVAGGVWPNMVVKVNGVQVGSATVNSAAYAAYPVSFNATAGTQTVSVEFTNDALVGTEDRNLIVDKFSVSCAGGGSTGGGSAGAGGSSGSSGSSGGTTTCSVPPALGAGQQSLTWYYFGQGTARNGSQYQTACGYLGTESGTDDPVSNIAAPNDYFVAIPGATSSSFTNSNYCGACVQITNTNNGRSVTATVIDECPIDSNPACATAGHLDVSKTAFDTLGFATGNPSSGVTWKVVPCNVSGNVKVRVKSGNANQVYIENERLPIQSVSQNGGQATRLSYGAWQLPSAAAGTTLVLTDVSGRSVSVAVSGATSDQDTGKQFPTCQ